MPKNAIIANNIIEDFLHIFNSIMICIKMRTIQVKLSQMSGINYIFESHTNDFQHSCTPLKKPY